MAEPTPTPLPAWVARQRSRSRAVLQVIGPGFIAGASNTDPTTVATLTVVGATTGYGLTWLVLWLIPMLVIVQVVSAAVGVCSRASLQTVIRRRYGCRWALVTLCLVLGVNLITLAADLEGGAAALGLLTDWSSEWLVLPFALAVGVLLLWGTYTRLERVLRLVLPIFLAYLVSTFLARPEWMQVLRATLLPQLSFSSPAVTGMLALLGTTLTSYVYLWETIEQAHRRFPIESLRLVQWDAGLGMTAAGILLWFIVIASGATLGVHHTSVATTLEAAAALAPFAGAFAAALFALGLLVSALLAVPILAGTSAYVLAETFDWPGSLDLSFRQAPAFSIAALLSLGIGASLTVLKPDPIQLLFLGSLVGGLGTPLTLGFLLLVARDRQVMGRHRISRLLAVGGWGVTAIVTTAGVLYLWQTFAQ